MSNSQHGSSGVSRDCTQGRNCDKDDSRGPNLSVVPPILIPSSTLTRSTISCTMATRWLTSHAMMNMMPDTTAVRKMSLSIVCNQAERTTNGPGRSRRSGRDKAASLRLRPSLLERHGVIWLHVKGYIVKSNGLHKWYRSTATTSRDIDATPVENRLLVRVVCSTFLRE